MIKQNLKVQYVDINQLKPADYNPRKWSEEAARQLTESIKRFGLVDPFIVNSAENRKNIVIGGHFRLKVAKDLGYIEVPVVFISIPDIEKEKELNLRLNKNVGEFDWDLLAKFDESFLAYVGFSSEELDDIFEIDDVPEEFDLEKELRKLDIKEIQIQKGDVYALGDSIQIDSNFRRALTRESFSWFFITYFTHYITCPTAPFQKEIFNLLQNDGLLKVAITAFRGSAKSTIASLAYPIWAMVGRPAKKYTLVVSQTQDLSKQILTNIKQELSSNELLIRDFGPFNEVADEWRSNSFVIPQFNARISAISQSESIRGLRHYQYRPDLIVIDDVEDLESVKTREGRDKVWNWFTGEVMPIGDLNTKIVIIGNLLHEDSLMMRLKESINNGKMDGVYKEYPLLDKNDNIAWLGKYPSMMHIETKRRQVADESAWYREYLLKFISDDKRIVQRSWPQFYDKLPDLRHYRILGIGIDLAISEKSSADFTSLVPFIVIGYGDDLKIYILPYIVNKRMNFPDTILEIKRVSAVLEQDYKRVPTVLVENVSYQMAVVQQLTIEKVLAEPVAISGMNKQTRLEMATPYIRQGKVLFPQKGAESLISQIVNFGIEKHDDLVDAFTIIVLKVLESDRPTYKSNGPTEPPRDRWGIDPFTGEYRNLDAPITAGMWGKRF